jgi:hypothetical protein
MSYQNSKIYALVSKNSDDIYIGSTFTPLSIRLTNHKSKHKWYKNKLVTSSSASIILESGDYVMVLLKNYPCENKTQLRIEEGRAISMHRCVNIMNPTPWTEKYKKSHYKEYNRKYYIKNIDSLKKKIKIYRDNNKEKLAEKRRRKMTCSCGRTLLLMNKKRHERSKFHVSKINFL